MTGNYCFRGENYDFPLDPFGFIEELDEKKVDDYLAVIFTKKELDEKLSEIIDEDDLLYAKKEILGNNWEKIPNFEQDVKDFFEPEAREAFEEDCAYERDPYAYNGVSRENFF